MYKIYKLIQNSNVVYIGVTKRDLNIRLIEHKSRKKIDNLSIELIEETTDKLREKFWIEKYNNLINHDFNVGYINNKECCKKYYQRNRDRLLKKATERRNKDREEYNRKARESYHKNKNKS